MKKVIIFITATAVFSFGMQNSPASGIDLKNNYKGYIIENRNYEEIEKTLQTKLSDHLINTKQINSTKHSYLDTTDNNNHCYIRFYPANHDTHIYIVSERRFDFKNNILTKTLNELSIKYSKLEDKAALREYRFDFIDLARKGEFDNFFILPDCIKPLKTTAKGFNNYISGKKKNTPLKPYSPDKNDIKLTLINSEKFDSDKNKISAIINEYRPKYKETKYFHAYEYIIKNSNKDNITLVSAKSENAVTLRDIEVTTLTDLDKLNLLSTIGSLLLIPTAGASVGLKAPNYIRIIKITNESKRYTKALPENLEIPAGSSIRILVMKKKSAPTPINFTFKYKNKEFEETF